MSRVLITGVRGKTGVPLAELLAARGGVEVRGGSSDPSSVEIAGVTPVGFSWDERPGWEAALEDVDAIYLQRPDRPDAPDLIAGLLAAAAPATRVVLLSEWGIDQFAPGHWAHRVEDAVRDGGRPWTILRPSWFMQVFTDPRFHRDEILEEGRLTFAGGGGSVAWIDARDIAAVAARALLDEGHDGEAHEISGPETLTLPRTAEALSAGLGRPIEHVEVTIAEAVADIPEGFERDEFVWTLERVRDGGFAGVSDTVERITGRPPRRLSELFAD